MSKKKTLSEQEEEEEEQPEEEQPDEEGDWSLKSIAKQVTGKVLAIAVVGFIVGILIGQVALPGLGIGLIALSTGPANAGAGDNVDMVALEAKVEKYLNDFMLGPQGFEGKITGIDSFDDDFYTVKLDIIQDGAVVDSTDVFLTKSGTAISGAVFFLDEGVVEPPVTNPQTPTGPPNVGSFGTSANSITDSGYEIELQDGKPVIRLFSTTWCPHCIWVKETFDRVAKEYVDAGKIVAFHWEVDTGDNTLTEAVESNVPASELAVFNAFNPSGGIPTFVFGGRYYRVGNAFEQTDDLVSEEAEFRAMFDELISQAGN